jgi:hypothetical protein
MFVLRERGVRALKEHKVKLWLRALNDDPGGPLSGAHSGKGSAVPEASRLSVHGKHRPVSHCRAMELYRVRTFSGTFLPSSITPGLSPWGREISIQKYRAAASHNSQINWGRFGTFWP